MKIAKIWRKRRAVSPILAAILLIGLAVAAGAVLFVIVLPMIQSSGEFSFSSVKFSDIDTDGNNDKVVFTLTNELTKSVTVTNVTIQGKIGTTWVDLTNDDNTTRTFPFNIGTSESEIDITYTFDPGTATDLRIKAEYKIGDEIQDPLYSSEYDAAV
ncbi:MAG: archaellin/type IV pilin N-terminal domain-containing protein [Candidatus Hodarchaeota archaeon]